MIPNTILLVDDDDTTNILNKFFAESLDDTIDVVTAVNGQEALDFLEENDIEAIGPCFVVLDVLMPVMDGWEFLAEFNNRFSDKYKEQVTISILTGLDSEKISKQAKDNPLVHDTVQKPLSDAKFRELITKHYKEENLSQ
ncbi:response regulator [Croceitalea sp. MTPC9]|uniref:response regulator n=1 Tax=unclassified Croceitalea TaxID=2632280 RepID=UPI002B365698|nr:response regulator [Croceitalea sp. MTPC6]GMN15674.1 response regulator [Croceitalea sp. MTPC9]